MRILVTGATGFIGNVVSEKLREAGHQVLGMAHSEEGLAKLKERGDAAVQADLSQTALLTGAAQQADGVIHLAFGGPQAVEVDRQATETFLEALAGSNKPFIYTSGVLVTGDSGNRVTDETEPLDLTGPVAWRSQHELLTLTGVGRGVRAIVVRPASSVYGRGGGGTVTQLIETARKEGAARYIGDGESRRSPVHVDDLAELYVLALEKAAAGEVFIGASDEVVQAKIVAEAASRAAGAGGKIVSWPYEEARKALGFLADIQTQNSVVSNAKARRVLGWQPHYPTLMDELAHGSYQTHASH